MTSVHDYNDPQSYGWTPGRRDVYVTLQHFEKCCKRERNAWRRRRTPVPHREGYFERIWTVERTPSVVEITVSGEKPWDRIVIER